MIDLIILGVVWTTSWVLCAADDKPMWLPITAGIVTYLILMYFIYEVYITFLRIVKDIAEIVESSIKKDDE